MSDHILSHRTKTRLDLLMPYWRFSENEENYNSESKLSTSAVYTSSQSPQVHSHFQGHTVFLGAGHIHTWQHQLTSLFSVLTTITPLSIVAPIPRSHLKENFPFHPTMSFTFLSQDVHFSWLINWRNIFSLKEKPLPTLTEMWHFPLARIEPSEPYLNTVALYQVISQHPCHPVLDNTTD